ncbi:transporter [Hespellia stercorisuis]|uniref:Transporter associated domain-containing protein n=1 Tax=Hespellia stercorisuis DSM 15480 TaxID=1121950 RepID=A0A1M6SCG5_9FIRM|nr:transporter [Hespellia stercorisuis]SHK42452.1 hypothetical protein SAMN02745243_02920 [Hespellia stercorisuis DSM 15480]
MSKYLNAFLKQMTTALEFVISLILTAGIIILVGQLLLSFFPTASSPQLPDYDSLMSTCFNLIIGVEMIRMLYQHTPHTVFEVLLFAIARQMIVDHSSAWNNVIGVVAIAGLFATRKFLFVAFDESERIIFRASQKVRNVNRLTHIHIPHENEETLGALLTRKLLEDGQEIAVGACLYFSDFGLRIVKMTEDKISTIELIRSLQ